RATRWGGPSGSRSRSPRSASASAAPAWSSPTGHWPSPSPAGRCLLARLAAVLQRAPAVPCVHDDPGADPVAVAPGVRVARVLPGQAVDVGQAGVLADVLDVADDADVGVPVALVDHVEGDPGVAADVLKALTAFVHVHQDPAVVPQVPGSRGYRLAIRPQGRDDRRVRLAQHRHRGLGKWWFGHPDLRSLPLV